MMSDASRPTDGNRASGAMIARLSAMMFLQYWPLGVWHVTLPTLIAANTGAEGDGIFSEGFVGYSQAASAIGSLATPLLLGWVADRFFSAEKLLSLLHLLSAVSVCVMYQADSQWTFAVAMLVYFQTWAPTVTLSNTIALRHVRDPSAEFATPRMFGTVAWILAGVYVGVVAKWWWGESIEATRHPLWISAAAHVVMALYSLTLPATPPVRGPRQRAGGSFRAILANRPFWLFLLISVLAASTSQAYNFANLFMNRLDYPGPAATLTLGQLTELACLFGMGWLATRFRLRALFLFGILAWGMRYAMLAFGSQGGPDSAWSWFVIGAILIHGPAYVFVYVAGQLYVDRLVAPSNRGVAQGLHALATTGCGHLIGAVAMGWAQIAFLTPPGVAPPPYHWFEFWTAPVLVSVVVAALFLVTFSEQPEGDADEKME